MNSRAVPGRSPATILWGIFIACIAVLAMWILADKGTENDVSSTYNPDKPGVKAFYELLARLHYPVGRLKKPYDSIPEGAVILIQVQPIGGQDPFSGPVSEMEQPDLVNWVRRGGVLIALSDGGVGITGELRESRKFGAGEVIYFDSRYPITNEAMTEPSNAVRMLRIIDSRFEGTGRILFDEYAHGFIESRGTGFVVGRHVWVALAIAAVCGAVLLHSRGKRFGAVRGLENQEAVRPGSEFVEAVGRMYHRAHAHGVAAGILGRSFRKNIARKLGVSSDLDRESLAAAVGSEYGWSSGERVLAVLNRCESRALDQSLDDRLLTEIAVEIHGLEQELGIGRNRSGETS